MDDLISIIVPVYNVEKYLKKCVESIINQTYKNIEIILVDDGSSDKSGDICDEYKKLDNRIRVYHKENGGLSDARNYGIDKANGKYICFVDSDDCVTEDMCEILYEDIIEFNSDVSFGTFTDCYDTISSVRPKKKERCKLTKEEAINYVMLGEKAPISAIAKLYKKNLFDLVSFEKGRTYEDAIIMVELLDRCTYVSYNSSSVYYYIHRENSITTQNFSKRNYDVIYAYEKNYEIIKNKYPQFLKTAKMRLCWANFQVLDSMVKSDYHPDKNIVKYLRSNFMFILRCQQFTKARKISMLALELSEKLYIRIAKYFYTKKRVAYK